MANLSITLFFLALIFYLQEATSEKPHFVRAAVFMAGVIEAVLSLST